jgi:hypothetical protein
MKKRGKRNRKELSEGSKEELLKENGRKQRRL